MKIPTLSHGDLMVLATIADRGQWAVKRGEAVCIARSAGVLDGAELIKRLARTGHLEVSHPGDCSPQNGPTITLAASTVKVQIGQRGVRALEEARAFYDGVFP